MDPFVSWLAGLEARHLGRFTFAEVRKALQAVSSIYVERRGRLAEKGVLDSAGKRAAFALFYAPLHFLFVREALAALGATQRLGEIVDLGCGTAPAGAAWASAVRAHVVGYEKNGWAAEEARRTLKAFHLKGRIEVRDIARVPLEGQRRGIVAAYTVNELPEDAQRRLLADLLAAGRAGARVLVVEPLSRSVAVYWPEWKRAILEAGGRADEWRFAVPLPLLLKRLDHAAGLDHRQLIGRTLFL
jgi:hypothetical protein